MTVEQRRFKQFMLDKYGIHIWWNGNNVMIQSDPATPGQRCGKSVPIIVAVAWEAWKEAIQYNPATGKRRWIK